MMIVSRILSSEWQQICCLSSRLQCLSLKSFVGLQMPEINYSRQIHSSSALLRKLDSRRHPPSREPSSRSGRWQPRKKMSEMYEYTIKPLPFPNTGGRGPNGRIWNHRRGGGTKKRFRMVDWVRDGPTEGPPLVERVTKIVYDPLRTANLALVASEEKRRYIIASQHMKPGDLIRSSRVLSKTPVRANEGDSFPVGSLTVGTVVHCVQLNPNSPARQITAAGCQGQIVRKLEDSVIIRLPSKQEVAILPTCTGTVGRVCNIHNNKIDWQKAGRSRWRGIRPRSGLWHRKLGIHGRKIRAPKKVVTYGETPRTKKQELKNFTFA